MIWQVGAFIPASMVGDQPMITAHLHSVAQREHDAGRLVLPDDWVITNVKTETQTDVLTGGVLSRATGTVERR